MRCAKQCRGAREVTRRGPEAVYVGIVAISSLVPRGERREVGVPRVWRYKHRALPCRAVRPSDQTGIRLLFEYHLAPYKN